MKKPIIKTAIIPVGGYGTRFLPMTKVIPKEMLPLGHKPLLLHAVESVIRAGIEHVILIVAPHKFSIERFFSRDELIEEHLIKTGHKKEVEYLRDITGLAKYSFVITKPPVGNGGCLLAAKHLIQKDEPFIVTWGDEIILTPPKTPTVTEQCLDAFEKHKKPIIAGVRIPDPARRSRYGMAELKPLRGDAHTKKLVRIVEKPKLGKEPSPFAAHNTYVVPYELFDAIEHTKAGKGGELWLSDALNHLGKKTGLLTRLIDQGTYFDCGDADNYVRAQALYAKTFANN